MKHSGELLSSFDRSWVAFSDTWKKSRAKGSEKSIHGLRVSTRRLIATLELTRATSRNLEIRQLRGRFKKILKAMGPLRDVQVQLKSLSRMRQAAPIVDFQRSLKLRERRQIAAIGKKLKRSTKQRLAEGVKEVRSEFVRVHDRLGEERIRGAVERVLKARRTEFLKTRKRFKPTDEETLHGMRIALKKLRYAVEAAEPVLGESAKDLAGNMRAFQQLLGDTRDIELLRARLEKWAAKRGNKMAIVPALESLQEKREELMRKIVESAPSLDNLFPEEHARPAMEKTLAVVPQETNAPPDRDEPPRRRMQAPAGS